MFYDSPLVINQNAAQMVYDVCWYLVKDSQEALRLTVITMRIAVSRYNAQGLPTADAYVPWLIAIASNESHRTLEGRRKRRPNSALLDSKSPFRDASYLSDTLAGMRADYKLALLLRYRYDVAPIYISHALDLRPRKVARLFVKAREEFASNSSMRPQMLAHAHPPRAEGLPQVVEPYSKREMRRSVLGYDWLETDFPVIPDREERRSKIVTLVATAVILIIVGIVVTQPFSAERPTLVDPAAVEETIDE